MIFTPSRDAPHHGTNDRYFDLYQLERCLHKHLMSSVQFVRMLGPTLRLAHPGSSENLHRVVVSEPDY
jgi:hypothetical protein